MKENIATNFISFFFAHQSSSLAISQLLLIFSKHSHLLSAALQGLARNLLGNFDNY
jgi:HEPN domain-containing protein